MRLASAAVSVAAVALLPSAAVAQLSWRQLNTTSAPSARVGHAMAHDLARDQVVLFGGQDASGRLADTWLFDGTDWAQALPAVAPVPRAGHPLAYDLSRGRVVLFGGIGIGTGNLGDTWEWDGQAWLQQAPATLPSPRRSQPLVFHPARGTVVMWGGFSGVDLNDMWEWDGVDWRAIVTNTSPPPRRATEIAYDPVGGGLLLFSGYLQAADTWYFDGADWQQRFPATVPPPRYDHSMAADLLRQRLVMVGGTALLDTWEWDGTDWLQRQPAGSPQPRFDSCLVHDLVRARSVMFSGSNNLADTWEYLTTAPATYGPFGQGCAGSNGQVPRLSSFDRPWLGEAFEVQVDQLPAAGSFTFMVTGFSNTQWSAGSLPFDLGVFGLTGCQLLVEPFVPYPIANVGGAGVWTLNLPNQPGFLGTRFFNQAATFDAAANPGGVTVTNAGDGTIGAR